MSQATATPEGLQRVGDRVFVTVARREADRLHEHLRNQGIGATLCLAGYDEPCQIELWSADDEEKLRSALAKWPANAAVP
jgi:hypothetical protein